jgi:hypothetical protein
MTTQPAAGGQAAESVPRRPSLSHRLLRAFMRSVGILSDGIRLGYRVGFDAGTMVDYVYANKAHGITPLGRLIDRIMLNHAVWKGVRARRELLIQHVRALLEENPERSLFDVAAGPGSYLFALPAGDLWAGDYSPDEVERGRERTVRESRPDIHYVQSDAFDPKTWPRPHFDILVASGFIDIIEDDADVRRLLEAGTAATRRGGHWVITVMEGHTDISMLRDVLVNFEGKPWVAVTRSAEQILTVAEPLGWRATRIDREPSAMFGVVTMERT